VSSLKGMTRKWYLYCDPEMVQATSVDGTELDLEHQRDYYDSRSGATPVFVETSSRMAPTHRWQS